MRGEQAGISTIVRTRFKVSETHGCFRALGDESAGAVTKEIDKYIS